MSVQFPPPALILSSIRHEIETTLLPALSEPRSIHVAHWISYLLGALIARDDHLEPALLVAIQRSLSLIHADDVSSHHAGASRVDQSTAATQDRGESLEVYRDLSDQIEQRVELHSKSESIPAARRGFISRAIEMEMQLIDGLDPTILDTIQTDSKTSPNLTVTLVNEYLARKFPSRDVVAVEVQAVGRGNSKDTFLLRLVGSDRPTDEVIIRRDVPFSSVDSTVSDEYPLVEHLHRSGFLVPAPLWLEPLPSSLGPPCMFVQKVAGEAAGYLGAEGRRLVFTADARANCGRELACTMAALHQIPLSKLGFPPHVQQLPTREHVANALRRSELYWKSRRLASSPILAAAFEWLKTHVPGQSQVPCLVHGDATPRNLMLHNGSASALLDWETARIGDPSEDLFAAQPEITQVIAWEEFLQIYYDNGGPRFQSENEPFYKLWAVVRNTVYASASFGVYQLKSGRNVDSRFAYSSTFYYYTFLRQIAAWLRSAQYNG